VAYFFGTRPGVLVRRLDRLDLVTALLRDRPGVTAADIAAELGVSVRSVFRDLAVLRDRGYPVEADRGRGGGVRLHGNWGLGRILLSTEEALGTLLSLAISEKLGLPMFAVPIAQARRKVVNAFPLHDRRRIAPLRERIFVGHPASRAVRGSYREPDRRVLGPLQAAFVRERGIRADYVKENGETSTRSIEPHAILINWPAWYVLGYDHARGEPRTFRFDRFLAVTEEPALSFRPRPREIAAAALGDDPHALPRPM
jgi:predicted DNA-binding transcriptional regulator YafY